MRQGHSDEDHFLRPEPRAGQIDVYHIVMAAHYLRHFDGEFVNLRNQGVEAQIDESQTRIAIETIDHKAHAQPIDFAVLEVKVLKVGRVDQDVANVAAGSNRDRNIRQAQLLKLLPRPERLRSNELHVADVRYDVFQMVRYVARSIQVQLLELRGTLDIEQPKHPCR